MDNKREYGSAPFTVVVVHGGPGAAGECASLSRELGRERGVIEHLQTADSLDGQITELETCLRHTKTQVTLVGHSYGAQLGLIAAARQPSSVKKLILVGSAVFEDKYAVQIMPVRRARLSGAENIELDAAFAVLGGMHDSQTKNKAFAQLGHCLERTDNFDLLPETDDGVTHCYEIYARVWPEMAALRTTGRLLTYAGELCCPVVAIHGEYDPHPAMGVREPLERVVDDFKFILLEKCGHVPWRERWAREVFYQALRHELGP